MNGFDEEDDLNIAQDTSADILNKGREASSDALANTQGVQTPAVESVPSVGTAPSFTRDEMLDRFANGGGYTCLLYTSPSPRDS